MNAKSFLAGVVVAAALCAGVFIFYSQRNVTSTTAQRHRQEMELSDLTQRAAALEASLAAAEKERDRLRTDAAEVHKLRGEISTLRKANENLQKTPAAPARAAAAEPIEVKPQGVPANFSNYSEVGQFAGTLRAKASNDALTPEEQAWLQQLKPQLEKLETSPQDFAAFQTAMIQQVAGVTDPEKIEKISQMIQKVYENATRRGLTLQDRPSDDPAWIEQRHQLDRRGTSSIQRILDETERAAFDKSFLGIMGVDLGTGVDKSLYPPGFLQTVELGAGGTPAAH